MLKYRLAILGAGAALALGTATAVAMESSVATDPGSHGEQVSATAQSDANAGDEHGAAVSAAAQSESSTEKNSEGTENDKGQRAAAVEACRTAAATADKTEATEPTSKAGDRTEDKTEHRALVNCIAGHTTAGGESK